MYEREIKHRGCHSNLLSQLFLVHCTAWTHTMGLRRFVLCPPHRHPFPCALSVRPLADRSSCAYCSTTVTRNYHPPSAIWLFRLISAFCSAICLLLLFRLPEIFCNSVSTHYYLRKHQQNVLRLQQIRQLKNITMIDVGKKY